MNLIKINPISCTKCGRCVKVCPTNVFTLDKTGPIIQSPQNCISCGHCSSICPNNAFQNQLNSCDETIEFSIVSTLSPKSAELFLRRRRSIRCYKKDKLSKEILNKLLSIARFAPTASNSQGISYMVISNASLLHQICETVVQWMEQNITSHWSFKRHVNNYLNLHKDTILRNAPHLILAIAPKDFSNGRPNTISALTYTELYAPSLGLGSCWAGLLEFCAFSEYRPLLDLISLPFDYVVTGALMIGYPQYQYQTLPKRPHPSINFIE